MAELAKKLHLKKDGVEQTAKAYSTTAEAGTEYIENKIDGVTCYVPIGELLDSRATEGKIIKAGAMETKYIMSNAKLPYTELSWTTPGIYTWTAPEDAIRARIATCGGGGGASIGARGGTGGTSRFGSLIQATGGSGGYAVFGQTKVAGAGGSPNGYPGSTTTSTQVSIYGPIGFELGFNGTRGDYGSAGNGWIDRRSGHGCATGGSGGYKTGYFDIIPFSTYVVEVGVFGGNGLNSSDNNDSVWGGSAGFVLIAFGGDI